ncbi:nuclear transport factor 2 family protein [Amycolatopsis saalfeldensis]|uniref:SnoaL-like domain-containing protein n=1 Tax=Amycolatopsis saalfeldensis TaxID=394193 RepID=A0A1H8U4F4_9PSEU|nr:nuclear transport factor 2 family protein [Amycolatopsis saalfeldensis]SEO97946.1 hypothetical protein SAMN04489732_10361 [Amycolatopsis saalfeldensis]
MSSTDENKKTVARFLEVFSTGHVGNILDLLAADVTWWVSGRLEGMSGTYDKAGFGRLIGGVADLYVAPLKITPVGLVAEGDKVTVEAKSHAELKDGRIYDPDCHFFFEVGSDGLIRRVHEYLDTQLAKELFFAN